MAKAARKTAAKKATGKARKAAPKKRATTRRADPADAAAALRAALLSLSATQGWRDLSLADIAEAAGLSMAAAHAVYPTKAALLTGLARATDQAVLASLGDDPLDGSAKDRLFDLMMRRFDLMQPSRDGYLTLLHELPQTPLEAACLAGQMRRSLRLMLETAGISAAGIKGALRLQGLVAIHMAALRAWMRDDSEDLAKTMAELDKRLGQAARLSNFLAKGMKRAEAMQADLAKAAKGAEA
jgi:ubiquinone biosynthesis protein COQ9